MAQVELIMPKMGESIIEATILTWLKQEGDTITEDEAVLEIATDKVDSEVPSPVSGTIVKILHGVEEVVEVGKPLAIIETESVGESTVSQDSSSPDDSSQDNGGNQVEQDAVNKNAESGAATEKKTAASAPVSQESTSVGTPSQSDRFYSPLVRNIAQTEGIGQVELEGITGTGMNNRVTKADILSYLEKRTHVQEEPATSASIADTPQKKAQESRLVAGEGEEIVEMGRMRKLIADHMVDSWHTSPHVTSFVEADVTGIVQWRNRTKKEFQEKYGQKITYTPIFMEAVIKAIHDFPGVNVSIKDDKIIKKHYINLGMAAARPDGNLIVPVIHNADELSLLGLTKRVNDLAARARNSKLKPEEIQGGTFTLTNVGTFGNVMGTPIINQPQVAILAVGAIRKKPAVLETEEGDVIAIRHKMFLSLSYDHRVVDGMLGGSFLRKIADYLEEFDDSRKI